jgi:lipopolysaccharide export system protein LptA
MYRQKNKILLAALLYSMQSFCSQACLAENADRDKPINLEADQVLLDDTQQISTFTGKVRLSQGTLLIRGDKVVVEQGKDGFKRATTYGNTADFQQKQEGSDTYAEAYGNRIEYDTRSGMLDIYGQARLKRGLDEVRGEHIAYNTKTEIFQVSGGNSADGAPPQRVHAVLQPKSKADTVAPGVSLIVPGDSSSRINHE